ncbi:hypothetical protein GCM10010324_49810 [Streptomyces hiroshimensis]|uniref:Uncharacterized protein n=1 Tax=Streptomyces hiroshimensis TaxID=66424 RepID=A0ABQ2YZL9_9ACTN|nr:hypothetical protein GCM10010324_49810 [Streptomyces hiroshimensis]
MSYGLVVWQGDVPSSDHEAARVHNRLYSEYLDGDELLPTVSVITEFLAGLSWEFSEGSILRVNSRPR